MLYLFEDGNGNSQLRGRDFVIPIGIKKQLQKTINNYKGNKDDKYFQHLTNITSSGKVDYGDMKKIKNFFDNFVGKPDAIEYQLNGGDAMKMWVNMTLGSATRQVRDIKQAKQSAGIKNAFIKPHNKNRLTKNATNVSVQKPNMNKDMTTNVMNGNSFRFENKKPKTVILSSNTLKTLFEDRNQLVLPFDGRDPLHGKDNFEHYIDWLESIGKYGRLPNANHTVEEYYNKYFYQGFNQFDNESDNYGDLAQYFYENFPPEKYANYYEYPENIESEYDVDINELTQDGYAALENISLEYFKDRLSDHDFPNSIEVNDRGLILIYRALQVPKLVGSYSNNHINDYYTKLHKNYDTNVGAYWAWNIAGADTYNAAYSPGDEHIVVYGLVDPKNINWEVSIMKNAYSLNNEMELELDYNAPVEIYQILNGKNKKFPLQNSIIVSA